MTTDQLQTQITDLRSTVRELEKATMTPSGDGDADVDLEARLGASQRLLARLETQLSELQVRERADREKAERLAAENRLVELEAIYRGECAELATIIDGAATELEPVLEIVLRKRGELAELNNEHVRLYKQLTGERPDVLVRPWRAGLIPGEIAPLSEPSPLYGHVALGLYAAVNEKEGGPFPLDLILSAPSGATMRRDAENPPVPTPKATEGEHLTEMQLFARGRRPDLQ